MKADDFKKAVVVYTPASRIRDPRRLFVEVFGNLIGANSLGFRLFLRDLQGTYRGSILGYVWALLPALATAAVWIVLRGQKIVEFQQTAVPYPVYVLVSMMLWQIFRDSVMGPLQAVQKSKDILLKVNFNRESIVLSGLFMVLFNSLLKLAMIALVFVFFGIIPSWTVVPGVVSILSLVAFGFAAGLLLVPISLLYADLQQSIQIILQFLMYLTPVVYPTPRTGFMGKLMALNPLVPIFETIRGLLLQTQTGYWHSFVIINLVVLALLLLGIMLFSLSVPIVNERQGSSK
jgi:lipopolysaccharide transport system permease protein